MKPSPLDLVLALLAAVACQSLSMTTPEPVERFGEAHHLFTYQAQNHGELAMGDADHPALQDR